MKTFVQTEILINMEPVDPPEVLFAVFPRKKLFENT